MNRTSPLRERVQKGERVMADKFTFGSAGEIQEVEFALARGGFTHPLLKRATSGDFLGLVREVLEGRAEICRVERLVVGDAAGAVATPYIINCDAKPFEPSGLTVAPEVDQLPCRVQGQLILDPTKIRLHLSPNQQDGLCIKGDKLKMELANKSVLPANVLDFYLTNSHLIPKELKGKASFFWGTLYRNSSDCLCVRYLYCHVSKWSSSYRRLAYDLFDVNPAVLRAS